MDIKEKKKYCEPLCDTVTVSLEHFCASGFANAPQMEDFDITDGEW